MFCFCRHGIDTAHLETSQQEKPIKICLIGTSDSGKTTVAKQFKQICHPDDYLNDPMSITVMIRSSIIRNIQMLCRQILLSDARFSSRQNMSRVPKEILSLYQSLHPWTMTKEIAFQMKQSWTDHGLKDIYLQSGNRLQMDDHIEYFMNKVMHIASAEYVPVFDDFIRLHARSCGCANTKLKKCIDYYGTHSFEIVDIAGVRSERKKWWKNYSKLTDNLDAIIYCVPLGDYDRTLFEDHETNRLIESINVWKETMIKADFFHGKQVFVLFNKYDVYMDKIKNIPITCCFDDFPEKMNPNDPQKVMQFIAGKFLEVFGEHDSEFNGSLHMFRANAIDTTSVKRVFNKITPLVIRQKHVA